MQATANKPSAMEGLRRNCAGGTPAFALTLLLALVAGAHANKCRKFTVLQDNVQTFGCPWGYGPTTPASCAQVRVWLSVFMLCWGGSLRHRHEHSAAKLCCPACCRMLPYLPPVLGSPRACRPAETQFLIQAGLLRCCCRFVSSSPSTLPASRAAL